MKMNIKIYLIILATVLGVLTVFARAIDNKTFKQYYNLTPAEFEDQLNDYIEHNQIDSAMLCADIQANKYDNKKLTTDEVEACCGAFRYIGFEYLQHFYNFQTAAENLLKAEQIANKYGFITLREQVAVDKAILTATQNDLVNNFDYNEDVIDDFKKAFDLAIEQTTSDNTESNRIIIETAVSNLLYLSIKFDKTDNVATEIRSYREAQKRYGTSCNFAEVMCYAIDYYNVGDYEKAIKILQIPLSRPRAYSEHDYSHAQVMLKIAKYAVLLKGGKRAEALKLLLQHEQLLRDNEITFEQLEALQLIWQHYEADGNKAMADKYALQYYIAKDEFINKSKMGKIDQAKLNVELEQTRERISEMSYRQRMQAVMLWGIAIIALLALALLGVLWMNYRKTRRTNRLLYEKNVALLAANQELLPASVATNEDSECTEHTAEKPASNEPTQADLELMDKITAVMESSPEVYSDTFSRQRLAELCDSNYRAVSRAVNICYRRNFNALLNEYRIKEACRRLMDSGTYGSYTIEGIANSVGYKSRSSFVSAFKEIVGLTPSAFQKMCREGKSPKLLAED